MSKQKILKQDGFIAIIALGIFLMLSLFGIIVQRVTTDTVDNVMTTIKHNEANDIADSVIEYLQYEMSQREAGFNLDADICEPDGSSNSDACRDVLSALDLGSTDDNVLITMEVEGRNKVDVEGDYLLGCNGIAGTKCYTVPHLGAGDAGNRCELYQTTLESATWSDSADVFVYENGQIGTDPTPPHISQLDYACNWNKLSFGSSSTDRVTIPLYYDESIAGNPDPIIVNPFLDITPSNLHATQLVIRVRPPCKEGPDVTVCAPQDRYFLSETEDDVVVQWQITAECGGESCGLIPYEDEDNQILSTTITESEINNNVDSYVVLRTLTEEKGVDTRDYNAYAIISPFAEPKLLNEEFEKPTLTLFLNEKLTSVVEGVEQNVPYLEYQILTDKPIGSPKKQAKATINIGGYVFEKTLSQQEQTSLIDFAVQN